jgi:hypothetical protein
MQSRYVAVSAGAFVALAVGLAGGGCKSEGPRTSTTTTTGAATSHVQEGITSNGGVNADGIVRIAEARCDRDQQCGAIGGPNARFATRLECLTDRREKTNRDLAAQTCPQGIEEEHLGACLDAVHAAPCSSSLEVLQSLTACKPSVVCKEVLRP